MAFSSTGSRARANCRQAAPGQVHQDTCRTWMAFFSCGSRAHDRRHAVREQVYQDLPELGQWAARQRAARQQGALTQERVLILESIGFDFGDEAQMTAGWEERFDQLVEWLLWQARA